MSTNSSPELEALIEAGKRDCGFDVQALPKGTMVDFETISGSVYTIVVVDPGEKLTAVVSTKEGVGPDIWRQHAGVAKTGGFREGWMGIDFGISMSRHGTGEPLTTSYVKGFLVRDEPEEAARIIREAGAAMRARIASKREQVP